MTSSLKNYDSNDATTKNIKIKKCSNFCQSLICKLFRLPNRVFCVLSARWRKLPDFIIIGVQKGGTTSLFNYLKRHPDLELSSSKEVHYYDIHYSKGLHWYRSFFPYMTSGKITGEATPYYIFHPQAAYRIKKDLPGVKLIVMLRDPVHRAYSHYQMERKKDIIATFENAIANEPERIATETIKLIRDPEYRSMPHMTYSYLSRGRYSEQLKIWFNYFSKDQFLFIKSEDFFDNPKEELKKVYSFLKIECVFPDELRPANVGNYPVINEITRKRLTFEFAEWNKDLPQLIGERFRWHSLANLTGEK